MAITKIIFIGLLILRFADSFQKTSKLALMNVYIGENLEIMYKKSTKIRCPFFRRRIADIIDSSALILQFIIARHKSLPILNLPPGCASCGGEKLTGLSLKETSEIIIRDWNPSGCYCGKGYYITGNLSKDIYKGDGFFSSSFCIYI